MKLKSIEDQTFWKVKPHQPRLFIAQHQNIFQYLWCFNGFHCTYFYKETRFAVAKMLISPWITYQAKHINSKKENKHKPTNWIRVQSTDHKKTKKNNDSGNNNTANCNTSKKSSGELFGWFSVNRSFSTWQS